MLTAAIILLILIAFALLRVGIIFEYNHEGPAVWFKAGFLKLSLDLEEDETKKKKTKRKIGDFKPGSFNEFTQLIKALTKTLKRFGRKLLIKELTIEFTSAGDDPAQVALQFGAANAAYSVMIPILERHFRIKKQSFRTLADFESCEAKIYVYLNISIAIWEMIYALAAMIPALIKTAGNASRKDDEKDGQGTDKQSAGNDNAENQGDDRG